ncbi:N-acetylglucosamine-6-phosphate deacetylase [Mycetocola spongiae]|uniref:N-acetylglucosamine-6-phosphate deacetylase n=1 Tax=Mycetocola spongiae TaxID=2859226 RepID=UPI001CF38277|nr:N-acetylglucosamine-6-phosphate deacetylase [Mycetocola spongiae]UCR88724.1 N-acetylglucosamine-6-phosphate deacetylase [Mycetocola spongiae]
MRTLIHSATLITGGVAVKHGWVEFSSDGRILARGEGDSWRLREETAELIDASGQILTPGFIDIHAHGGGGFSYEDGPAAVDAALSLHRAHGTTRSVLSLVTGDVEELMRRVGVIADLAEDNPLILGSHLEGPFLDPGHRGAHDPEYLIEPDIRDVDRLIAAGQGTICQVTLAPELPGSAEAIRRFTAAGIAVAVGHTDADYEGALAAFSAGASILTHAFNAMNPIHHRAPGPVLAAADSPHVTLEIVNDGVHVHPSVVELAFEMAPGRVALITDAMAAAGNHDGHYLLGTLGVIVTDGVARLEEGGAIAGSTLTLDQALLRAVRDSHIPLPEAVRALTETPARTIGRGNEFGALDVGFAADIVLLDQDLSVLRVWADGEPVPRD